MEIDDPEPTNPCIDVYKYLYLLCLGIRIKSTGGGHHDIHAVVSVR